jgi:aminomethyltransferase
VQHIFTNDVAGAPVGKIFYGMMCYEDGGTVDDLLVYKMGENDFFLVINAANIDKDWAWIQQQAEGFDIELSHRSDYYGQLAVQGPEAESVVEEVLGLGCKELVFYTVKTIETEGETLIVSRTGYTGEDGFEIYMPADKAPEVWETLIEEGKDDGLITCALGARDTLRLEAGMPLYGHEITEDISPKTSGLGFAIKMDKPDFIGKAALEADQPLKQRRVGLKVTGRGILREHLDVYRDGKLIGHTTSGTFLPYLGSSYGMAIVDTAAREIGAPCQVDVRGRMVDCEMVALPFYKRSK